MDDDEQSGAWMEQLSDDARPIWSNANARVMALDDIARAWRQGDPELDELVQRFDAAVVEGLAALGFPRGPVRQIIVRDIDRGVSGQKFPDCVLVFYGPAVEAGTAGGDASRFFSTWIHESIHARQPYSYGAIEEYRRYRGFEEGLVEGLTRHILARVGIWLEHRAFAYFVSVYESLADVLEIETVELWRLLWVYPAGSVSSRFVDTLAGIIQRHGGLEIDALQRQRLFATAAGLFRSNQDRVRYDALEIRRQWEGVLNERR